MARQSEQTSKARSLAAAIARYSQEVDHAPPWLGRRLDFEGLAGWLVADVDQYRRDGHWLPLGPEKAPAFLAAVARHEVSWRWRDPRIRGSIGEGCAFQIAPNTARMVGYQPEQIAHDRHACFAAAVEVMRICAERCGEVPAERWMGCYASAGHCGAAREVIAPRFETARQILAFQTQ